MQHLSVNAFLVARDNPNQVLDNFSMQEFEMLGAPRVGDEIILHNGEMGPPKLHRVEIVRFVGRSESAGQARKPKIEIYVSLVRTMSELA